MPPQTTITVHEFRKNIKAALDFCVEGGSVEIDRMGQRFILMYQPRGTAVLRGNLLPTQMPTTLEEANDPKSPDYSANIRPDIPVIKTPAEAVEAVGLIKPVKKGKHLCVHGNPKGSCFHKEAARKGCNRL